MQLDNRYLKLTAVTLLVATLIYLFLLIIFSALNIEFPGFYQAIVSLLGAGYLVYSFLAPHIQ